MKKHINLLSTAVCAFFLFFALNARAGNDPEVEKTKAYTKTYTISGSDKISVNNQFGEVKIIGWNKNEVKVDVTVISRSSTDERAQEILDRISIEDGKNSGGVYFKTTMKDEKKSTME